MPCWDSINGNAGAIKITEGCPFHCTYCSAPLLWPGFVPRPAGDCMDELQQLIRLCIKNVAFYDDAILFKAEQALVPFLEGTIRSGHRLSFHSPNALNARPMITGIWFPIA
jgi:pyruvate-formate lyase-activating enzyme